MATATSMATFLMPFYLQDVLRLSPSFMGLVFLAAPVFTIALRECERALDRPDRTARAGVHRRARDDGRLPGRPVS